MTIGQRINLIRYEKDLSLDQLAQKANVSKNTICYWIYRGGHPDIELLCSVADVLEVSLDELAGRAKNVDRCVVCGEIIPEGRQVCPICEKATP